MKLTPWFGATTRPVRPGVYQRRHRSFGFYIFAKWNGSKWLRGSSSVDEAAEETIPSASQMTAFYWRGVQK